MEGLFPAQPRPGRHRPLWGLCRAPAPKMPPTALGWASPPVFLSGTSPLHQPPRQKHQGQRQQAPTRNLTSFIFAASTSLVLPENCHLGLLLSTFFSEAAPSPGPGPPHPHPPGIPEAPSMEASLPPESPSKKSPLPAFCSDTFRALPAQHLGLPFKGPVFPHPHLPATPPASLVQPSVCLHCSHSNLTGLRLYWCPHLERLHSPRPVSQNQAKGQVSHSLPWAILAPWLPFSKLSLYKVHYPHVH